jgi:hypothetical protein
MNHVLEVGVLILGIYALLVVLCVRQYPKAKEREGGDCMLSEAEFDFLERTPRALRPTRNTSARPVVLGHYHMQP